MSRCRGRLSPFFWPNRYPVTATEFHLIGKATERGWEQNDDISTLMPLLKRYITHAETVNNRLQELLLKMPFDSLAGRNRI
jgi:hypothetical protein